MTALRALAVIGAKDLRQQLRSGTLLLFAVVLPLGLAFLFNTILGGAGESFQATYAVVDQDRGPWAEAFTDDVLAAVVDGTDGAIEVRTVADVDQARRLTEDPEVSAAFVIPPGFSADIEAGREAELAVIGNVDATIGVQVARSIAEAYAAELSSVRLAVAAAAMAVLVGVSTLVLGAGWGDPRGVAALLVAVALAATGLMAVVATFAPSTEQATNWMSASPAACSPLPLR